jgi:hypothetical protein
MTNGNGVNLFGFSTEPSSGGDFTPIIKFDSRAGRVFRIDRVQDFNGYNNEQVDITHNFRAVVDFENVEVGWINFPMGGTPSFMLVPMGQQLPPRPSVDHKNGLRFMMKLDTVCGGEKKVREIASSAKAFLGGVEQIYAEYLRQKDSNPGKLPVLALTGTMPIETGTGAKKSTNYRPSFRIEGWVTRPADLIYVPKGMTAPQAASVAQMTPQNGNYPPPQQQAPQQPPWEGFASQAAPQTGGQVVSTPPARNPQANLDSDFG